MFRQEVYQAMCHKSNLGTLLDHLFLFQTFTVVDEIWQFSTSDGWRDMWTNILIKHRNHILLHKHWCRTFIIWHSFIIPCYQQEAPHTLKRNSQVLKFSTLNKVDHRPKNAPHAGTQKLLTGCKAFFCLKPSLKRVLMSQKNVCHKRCRLSK